VPARRLRHASRNCNQQRCANKDWPGRIEERQVSQTEPPLRGNLPARLACFHSIADWAMRKRNNGRGQQSLEFRLVFLLYRASQTAPRSIVCRFNQSGCRLALVKMPSGFRQTRRLAFVRIDESFSPIALSTYIDARTQSKGFRLDHYNRATWGISWHIFLIWHCIPGNRTHRAK
jgi:hypothetical protein